MAENSWTREENEKFKDSLVVFSAFLPTRLEKIAEYLQKPVPDVKKHYEEMVNDLLRGVAFPNELNEAQSSYEAERTKWCKETHEWFLIGLKRYGKDWRKIAILLDTKNPMQVAMNAHKYFDRPTRANSSTVAATTRASCSFTMLSPPTQSDIFMTVFNN